MMPPAKRRRVTVTALPVGIDRAEKSLLRLGFESKSNFAKAQLIGKSTVDKFFNRQPIQLDTFKRICEALKIEDWRSIAELEPLVAQFASEAPGKEVELDVVEAIASQPMTMNLTAARHITIANRENGEVQFEIVLKGDIASIDDQVQKTLETIFRRLSGSTITITDIKAGSIRIKLQGSPEDAARLIDRLNSGELTEIDGLPVEDIQILSQGFLKAVEENSSDKKWYVVQEIISHSAPQRQLSDTDLSEADLRGANLSEADLSGADLGDADLRGADLGDADLSDADLGGANLGDANLRGANLGDADLSDANLGGANLRVANLGDADLSGANLGDADLRGADLGDADLRGADLGDADLRGADFSDSRDRARVSARDLDRTLDRILDLAIAHFSELASARVRARELARLSELARELASARASARELARNLDLTSELDRASELARDLISELDRASELARDLTSELDRGHLFYRLLTRARDRARLFDLTRDLDLARDRALELTPILHRARTRITNRKAANLSGAIVENARFGEGIGLTEAEKLDLQQRGAIFNNSTGDREFTLR
ncbi:pentapeptide repeat-containing protein [Trichocoleus desertorum AS-A10]|uniref:pentapeptide repeat-containing protein n=1 Tax=Trichocoleus desertorum TaxID=1481672 RepID=UPI0032972167